MQPKPQKRDAFELFQSHFDQLLNPAHELVQLAQKIDWARFEASFAGGYSPDMGAPAKATRLMVGLQYLKYTFNYFEYYLNSRTHLSLDRNSPVERESELPFRGRIVAVPQVGGLHHRYRRAA